MIQISQTTTISNAAPSAAPASKTAASSAAAPGPAKPAPLPQGVGGNVDKSA